MYMYMYVYIYMYVYVYIYMYMYMYNAYDSTSICERLSFLKTVFCPYYKNVAFRLPITNKINLFLKIEY